MNYRDVTHTYIYIYCCIQVVDVPPVDEVGSAEKPNRSMSIQCSAEGVECGTYAHGMVLQDTAHSRSLDSGMVCKIILPFTWAD